MKIFVPTREPCIPIYLLNSFIKYKMNLIDKGSIESTRNAIIQIALKQKEDIIMLDRDIEPLFEFDLFIKTAEYYFNKGYDVVCGVYYLKTLTGISAGVSSEKALQYGLQPISRDYIWLPYPPNIDLEVDVCGTGLIAISYNFLQKIKDGYPWFRIEVSDGEYKIGEDVYFFMKFKPKAILAHNLLARHYVDSVRYLTPDGFLELSGELKTKEDEKNGG